jgi:hypothetical protein
MKSFEGGSMLRSSRERVVLPDEDGPEMPSSSGVFMVFYVGAARDTGLSHQVDS